MGAQVCSPLWKSRSQHTTLGAKLRREGPLHQHIVPNVISILLFILSYVVVCFEVLHDSFVEEELHQVHMPLPRSNPHGPSISAAEQPCHRQVAPSTAGGQRRPGAHRKRFVVPNALQRKKKKERFKNIFIKYLKIPTFYTEFTQVFASWQSKKHLRDVEACDLGSRDPPYAPRAAWRSLTPPMLNLKLEKLA